MSKSRKDWYYYIRTPDRVKTSRWMGVLVLALLGLLPALLLPGRVTILWAVTLLFGSMFL